MKPFGDTCAIGCYYFISEQRTIIQLIMFINNKSNQSEIPIEFRTRMIHDLWYYIIWISSCFQDVARSPQRYYSLLKKLDNVLYGRGALDLITYVKRVRTSLMNYLSGNPLRVPQVKITKDGLPKCFGDLLIDIRRSEPREILPVLNSILFSTRSLKVGKVPDIKPITSPPLKEPLEIGQYTESFWRSLGYRRKVARFKSVTTFVPKRPYVPKSCRWKRFHISSKAGPSGHALWTSIQDLYSLPDSLIESIKIVAGDEMSSMLDAYKRPAVRDRLQYLIYGPKSEKTSLRKLTYFPDKEDKVRVIAILDYWSQTALKPLHHFLYGVLRKINQDCTFNQGAFQNKLNMAKEFYSIDLKSATDRFPITTIMSVLKGLFPPTYVDAWKDIMVGYPFDYQPRSGKKCSISYGVGNPMGAYSSWASFAVVNHYVVYYCCRELGKDWRNLPYALLGDDIVIGDKEVGEMYIRIIGALGVEVSELKTHKSRYLYEFAKRWTYKGQEISPFPISALKESQTRYYKLVNLLMETERRGWTMVGSVPETIEKFYDIVRPRGRNFRKKVLVMSRLSEYMTKVMQGSLSAQECVKKLLRQFGLPYHVDIEPESGKALLSSIARVLFDKANTSAEKKGKMFGQLALDTVLYLSSEVVATDLLLNGFEFHYIPILNVQGQIEEKMLEIQREAIDFDQLGTDWPLTLRSITYPVSDEHFFMRNKDLRSVASSAFGRELWTNIETLLKEAKAYRPGSDICERFKFFYPPAVPTR